MKFFDRIRNAMGWLPQTTRTYLSRRQAGMIVTEDTAMAYSAVNACVRIISETLGSLPWSVYRRLDTGGRESLPRHGVQWLLNTQANPEMSAFIFRRLMLSHMLVWGNAYAEIERGLDGRAIWLWPLMPDRTVIQRSETGALIVKVSDANGGQYVLPRENVFHLSDGGFDGIVGLSRIQLAKRAVGIGMAQDAFGASYYANGATIGGVISQKTGKTLSVVAKDELLNQFNEKYAGPDRSHKTMYLDGGMEYQPLSLPLSDAQFLETRRFQVEEIARWYGVPMHLLNDLTNANYAISYEASKNFVEHTLRPICVLAEQEANIRLFAGRVQNAVYSRINLTGLLRADPKTRGDYYRSMVHAGIMSINEVRELEDMNSIGTDGDEHYLQSNMTTLALIAAGMAPQQGAAPQQGGAAAADAGATGPTNVIRREALDWWNAGGREGSSHG